MWSSTKACSIDPSRELYHSIVRGVLTGNSRYGFGEPWKREGRQTVRLSLCLSATPNTHAELPPCNALLATVAPGSRILHDDWGAYRALPWSSLPYEHSPRSVVNHSKEIRNIFGESTNHVEALWSSLKRWWRAHHGGRMPTDEDERRLAVYVGGSLLRQ